MMLNKNSRGVTFGLDAAAAIAALRRTVLLLGGPRWRPPRLSPVFDPLGIALINFSSEADWSATHF
jgi:hypothetical protein